MENSHKMNRYQTTETLGGTVISKIYSVRLTSGVSGIVAKMHAVMNGTSMSTTESWFKDWIMKLQLSPVGEGDVINSPENILAKHVQKGAKGVVVKDSLSATVHTRDILIVIDPGVDLKDLHLGVDDVFEQLNVRLEFNTQEGVNVADKANISSITVSCVIEVHMDSNENDSMGYRQYIYDAFGIDVKDSNTRVRRILQSNRDIDSILINNPPDCIKSVKILRETNVEAFEEFIDVAKATAEQIYNVSDAAIIDPIEMIQTGSHCELEFDLGTVSGPTTIEFLTEYLNYQPLPVKK